ncbi:MAG: hypothetical protein LBJ86_01285 [Spirochaetaceae bacterium]|jgi:hypothetical protein|nr:hypothetical protein [Spirochaetaceae bacterium]
MMDNSFLSQLKEALDSYRDYLARTELPALKESFRVFQREVSALYSLLAKKGYIIEDPYKNETKTGDLKLPPSGNFNDMNKRDQLGLRLSMLDNELDYLVNFHEFSIEDFHQEKIKVMAGLVKYVDWLRLTSADANVTTQAVCEAINGIRQGANDPIAYKMLSDSLAALSGCTNTIMAALKLLSDFNREQYKYNIRIKITSSMSADEATLPNIKKKFAGIKTKSPFYPDLVEEVVKEDYSKDSNLLQGSVLQRLAAVKEERKPQKEPVSFRPMLIDGLNIIGAAGINLSEMIGKINENHYLLEKQNNGIWAKIKRLIASAANRDTDAVVYELEYNDPVKGSVVHEKLNYKNFCASAEKKLTILGAIAARGSAAKKLEGMNEEQLTELLQRNIKDLLGFHKTLGVLDEYFKAASGKANRSRIRGIKPELSALKNTVTKASDRLRDYKIQKEEEAQFKKLGISADEL